MKRRQPQYFHLGWVLLSAVALGGCQPATSTQLPSHSGPPVDPNAPHIPTMAVLRPFFQTSLGANDAGTAIGTAFGAQLTDQTTVALTAISLFGPDSELKLSREISPTELGAIHRQITFGDAFGSFDGVVDGDSFLEIPEAGWQASDETPAGDVLAIKLPAGSRIKGLPLAKSEVQAGDRVWLCTALFAGAPPSQKQHSAQVIGYDERGNLLYKLENPRLSFRGTTGAPVLNDAGEVVAIHIAGDDKLIGTGNPTSRFLPYASATIEARELPEAE